ncbi:Dehydrogenase aclE, partial [Pseudocercospora fuligena]
LEAGIWTPASSIWKNNVSALDNGTDQSSTHWAVQVGEDILGERGRDRFEIRALLNSSVDAAKRAIEYYNLPPDTKAYGSADDLAKDGDIDLVVCTTRVDVHYDTVKPSVEAGKAVFVEWPLAENVQRATELADLARKSGSLTLVGIQARVGPVAVKLRELLGSREVGKVLSSSVQAFSPYSNRESVSEGLAYFLDKAVGGNPITIAFGHMIDFVHSVIGEFESSNSHVQIQHPEQAIIGTDGKEKTRHTSDVPDLLSLHGTLQPSTSVAKGASLIVNFRKGPPFPGTLPFVWTINCEKAEIRITSERGPFLQSESNSYPVPIELHDFASGEVKKVEWHWEDWQEVIGARSRNIGKLYDLYAEGKLEAASCATFDSAVWRHKQLDRILYEQ